MRHSPHDSPGDSATAQDSPAYAMAEAPFATVFREALRQRGLPLERVRDRLESQGISISLATLSYWQRGRSQPERAQSLRAVDAMETILDLPEGALRSLLGPHRPRGRAISGVQDLTVSQRVFGENSTVEQALGEAFAHFNEDVRSLAIHETLRLDERRCVRSISMNQVLRATRDGASHMAVVHGLDDSAAEPVDVAVNCGRIGSVRLLPELRSIVVDIQFGRELAENETVVVDYEILLDRCQETSTHHEHRIRATLRQYFLHVYFHPEALPVNCFRYYREQVGAEQRHTCRMALDVSHSAHMLAARCPVGIHGMCWEWPS